MIHVRNSRSLEKALERFREIDDERFLGVHKRGIDLRKVYETITDGRTKIGVADFGIQLGDLWVRRLGEREYGDIAPTRFTNALTLYQKAKDKKSLSFKTPEPLGLVYTGGFKEYLKGKKEGYIITRFIEGKRLTEVLGDEEREEEKVKIVNHTLLGIESLYRDTNLILLDFAPRDILVRGEGDFVFCDTENVRTGAEYRGREEVMADLEKQFREDYKDFLKEKSIDSIARIAF